MSSLIELISSLGREAGRIVLPSACAICEKSLPWLDRRASCCRSCWDALTEVSSARCTICALALDAPEHQNPICGACRLTRPPFEWIESFGPYEGGLDRLLQAFKFQSQYFLAEPLAGLMLRALARRTAEYDRITAVPMTARRERARGFNQAELLARELSRHLDVPYDRRLITRSRTARTQSELPRSERAANVRGSFAAGEAKGHRILLVDDVCTTGETLRECARVLRKGGATSVYAVTVARA